MAPRTSCFSRAPRLWITATVLLATILAGCGDKFGSRTQAPGPGAPENPEAFEPRPYILQARAQGQVINFQVTNTGTSNLDVSPFHFALVETGQRRVIPYSPSTATIEVASSVRPGETVSGRAIFHEFTTPRGFRLAFRPDNLGTFAQIN